MKRFVVKQYDPENYEIAICDTIEEAKEILEKAKEFYKQYVFDEPEDSPFKEDISKHEWDMRHGDDIDNIQVFDNSFSNPDERYLIFEIIPFQSGKMYNVDKKEIIDNHNFMYDIKF